MTLRNYETLIIAALRTGMSVKTCGARSRKGPFPSSDSVAS
jgi:hypothetical protein